MQAACNVNSVSDDKHAESPALHEHGNLSLVLIVRQRIALTGRVSGQCIWGNHP
jgi:hypothetical protein